MGRVRAIVLTVLFVNAVMLLRAQEVIAPAAFAPNAETKDDQFCISGATFRSIEIKIFNRWGEMVFTSNEQKLCWDGKYKGEYQPGGVYFWTLKGELNSGKEIDKTGSVTLIR